MSTPERGRRATDLFDERLIRLKFFIDNNAPRNIIAGECELILRAHHGGRIGTILYLLRELIRHCWMWYLVIPAQRWLCEHGVWHRAQDEYGYGCPFCDRNTRADILAAEQEDAGCAGEIANAMDL